MTSTWTARFECGDHAATFEVKGDRFFCTVHTPKRKTQTVELQKQAAVILFHALNLIRGMIKPQEGDTQCKPQPSSDSPAASDSSSSPAATPAPSP